MSVRAKVKVSGVELYGGAKKIKWHTVYEGSLGDNEENKRFTQATPQGEIWMAVDNPYAANQFELGDEWYVTFEKAGPPAG